MAEPKAFKVLKASALEPHATLGSTIYRFWGCDYGCASDDTRILGVKHSTFTLNADGSGPFFTMATRDVEEIKNG